MSSTTNELTATAEPPLVGGIGEYDRELEVLDRLLRGELAAIETYDLCLDRIEEEDTKRTLSSLRNSHSLRSEQIHNHIALLGGEPSESSGAWGALAKVLEGGASRLSTNLALEALEAGERHGIREYLDVDDLEPETRAFVRDHLRPEQERTHAALSELRRTRA